MFLQVCVCPQGGVCLSACWDTTPWSRHPPEQTSPPLRSRHPHPREQTPTPPTPREQTPPPPKADTPGSRHPPGADTPLGADTPQEQTPPWEQTPPKSRHPPGADTPLGVDTPREQTPSRDGHCCGRYASYWNAFLC